MIVYPGHCFKNYIFLLVCFLWIFLFSPLDSYAQNVSSATWDISADKISRQENPQVIIAEGNVVLEKKVLLPAKQPNQKKLKTSWWYSLKNDNTPSQNSSAQEVSQTLESKPRPTTEVRIEAEKIAYYVDEERIELEGNVQFIRDGDTLQAESGKVDLATETGSFDKAVISKRTNDLHLEGERITKTGYNTYTIENGWVITCKVEPGSTPPWSFASRSTTVEKGGYAFLRHATFNVKGVPIFYTPYLVVPVKDTRQTGFILPEFSFSELSGFGSNTPFFLNINDSMDMTFFPEFYEKRGIMPGVEFRYVTNASNKGTALGSYLNDSLSGDPSTSYYRETGYTHTNSKRYWLRAKIDHTFPGNWLSRVDLDLVSDEDYLKEFDEGYTGFVESNSRYLKTFGRGLSNKTDATRENTLKIQKSWAGQFFEIDILAINDRKKIGNTSQELWKLPEISSQGRYTFANFPFAFEWEANYVYYWREQGLGGHRVDFRPAISAPLPLLPPHLESRAELGIRETYYAIDSFGTATWTEKHNQNRIIPDFSVAMATTLMRHFSFAGTAQQSLIHQLHPYVEYRFIPKVNQDTLPMLDEIDFISRENGITYGIDNYFTSRRGSNYRELGSIKISQKYNFHEEKQPFSPLVFELDLRPTTQFAISYDTDIDCYGEGFLKHDLEAKYTTTRGDAFSLEYTYKKFQDIKQINAEIKTQLFSNWATALSVEHSLAAHETNEANLALIYTAPCWSVEFQSQYSPEDMKYLVVFTLANIGTPFSIKY